jgi:hypothetical protein
MPLCQQQLIIVRKKTAYYLGFNFYAKTDIRADTFAPATSR